MTLSSAEREAGLTAPLPAAEKILWQVKPVSRRMTASVFRLRGIAIYFALAAIAIIAHAALQHRPIGQGIAEATLLIPFALAAFGLLVLIGRMTARHTTYTLTNRRLILHIGIAYEMTVSIPLSAIVSASLRRGSKDIGKDGTGDIVFSVRDGGGAGYVGLWPHARPWRFLRPQPMLRALPDVEEAAERIGDALTLFNAGGRTAPATRLPLPTEIPAAGRSVVPA